MKKKRNKEKLIEKERKKKKIRTNKKNGVSEKIGRKKFKNKR